MKMDALTQQYALASLEGSDLTDLVPLLEKIAERDDVAPLAITFALTLLHQTGYSEELTVQKFGWEKRVIPADMTLPGQDDLTKQVLEEVIVSYCKIHPDWKWRKVSLRNLPLLHSLSAGGIIHAEEVATAYVNYIESLFSGEQLPETALNLLIQQIDNDSDL